MDVPSTDNFYVFLCLVAGLAARLIYAALYHLSNKSSTYKIV